MKASARISGEQRQTQKLAPHMMQGLKLLAKSLPELRAEIAEEISRNPAIEDVDHPLDILFGVKWNFGKMNATHSQRAQSAAMQMAW